MAVMARYTPTMGGILSDVGNAFKNALNTVNPMNAKNVVTSGFNSVVDAVKNPFSPTKQFNLLKNSAGVEIFKQNYNDITRNIPESIALPKGFLKKNTTVSAGGGTTAIPQNVVDEAAAAFKSGSSWGALKQGTSNKSRAVVKANNTTPGGRSAGSSKMNFEDENPVDNAAKIEQQNPQGTQQARQEGAAAQNAAAQQEAQTSTGAGAGGSTFYINLPETQKTEDGGDYKKWLLIGGFALAALYLLKGDTALMRRRSIA